MRILYHAINGVGLGHLMRLSAVASAVRTLAPHVHQLFATSANYPAHLKRLDMPVMILPDQNGPLVSADKRARSVSSRFFAQMLNHLVDEYDPRVVVFDTHVSRALVAKVVEDGRKAVLVFRACRDEFLLRNLKDGAMAQFDLVLAPHTAEEFQSGLSKGTLALLRRFDSFRYVGPIVFPAPRDDAALEEVCRRHNIRADAELIVVAAGGGGLDRLTEKMFRTACEAVIKLRAARPTLQVLCVGGPYASALLLPAGCAFVQDEPAMQALLLRADLVIAKPGYNTVQEILTCGTRAILVPPMRPKVEDLEWRIAALVARGRVLRLGLDAGVAEYSQVIDQALQTVRPAPERSNGAGNAAEELLGMAAEAEYFICSREPLARSLAFSFRSPTKLARALRQLSGAVAILRVDWDLLAKLLASLDDVTLTYIRKIEVALGSCPVEDAEARIRDAYGLLHALGFADLDILFCVNDPSAGALLSQLAARVADLRFNALVARVSGDTLQSRAKQVFESLEACRDLNARFKIDITLMNSSTVFIDQP